MHLDEFVSPVAAQLTAAAELGDDSTRRIAETLARAAEPAVRLALLSALSAAADEITSALLDLPSAPSVTVVLDGPEIAIEVRGEAVEAPEPARVDDAEATARVSLRLSEALKADVEAAAAADGVSLNTWLVRAAAAALRRTAGGSEPIRPGRLPAAGRGGHRITGWVNG